MDGTPIFDELRNLLDNSEDLFGALETPSGADRAAAPAESSPEAGGRPPGAREGSPGVGTQPAKIVVAGGRGAGKTTFVGSLSDTDPITVEAATDFGRVTLHRDLVLYLFGTSEPAQPGFGGALGAVVLVDARRITDAFPTISYFENHSDVPFIVAVNVFDGELHHELDEVREAFALGPDVPLTTCDARELASTATVLQELVAYALSTGASDRADPPDLPA